MISLQTILILGFLTGAGIAPLSNKTRIGCWSIAVIPVAAIAYVSWWQGQHPQAIRSTSGLDYLFVPLWPSLAGMVGYALVGTIKDWLSNRNL